MEDLDLTDDVCASQVFIGLLDQSTLDDAKCFAEMLIAKELKKPMFYIVPEGIELPKDYTEGVEYLRIRRVGKNVSFPEEAVDEAMSDIDAFVAELRGKGMFNDV